MGGKSVFTSKKIKDFRSKLWNEHFSLDLTELQDPIDQDLWTKVYYVSQHNTVIYRKVFGCYPDNTMRRLKHLKEIKENSVIEKYEDLIKEVHGNATEYPYNFLVDEPIANSVVSKEYFIPK
jgi:phospholipase D1/2